MIVGAFESTFPYRLTTSVLPPHARAGHAPPSAPSTQAAVRQLLCGYPSKICTNERAWKRDGSLHRFCEEHRVRANTNQKRWAQRKARTKSDKSGSSEGEAAATSSAAQSPAREEEYQVDDSMLQAKAPMDFSDFDMTLELLLKDASFWSPTASSANARAANQWEQDDLEVHSVDQGDVMEAELWAALGLGNVNMSL